MSFIGLLMKGYCYCFIRLLFSVVTILIKLSNGIYSTLRIGMKIESLDIWSSGVINLCTDLTLTLGM